MKQLGITANQVDDSGRTLLHHAVLAGNMGIVEFLVSVKKVDPNFQDSLKKSALHWICDIQEPKIEIARYLVKNGAEVLLRDVNGNTPLHYACAAGSQGLVELLLQHGVDPNIKNDAGFPPSAQINGPDEAKIAVLLKDYSENTDDADGVSQQLALEEGLGQRKNSVPKQQPGHHRKPSSASSVVRALFAHFLDDQSQTQEEITAQCDDEGMATKKHKKTPKFLGTMTVQRPQLELPRENKPIEASMLGPRPRNVRKNLRPPPKSQSPKKDGVTPPHMFPVPKLQLPEPMETKEEGEDEFPTLDRLGSFRELKEDLGQSARSLESFTNMSFGEGSPAKDDVKGHRKRPSWTERIETLGAYNILRRGGEENDPSKSPAVCENDKYSVRGDAIMGEEDFPLPPPPSKSYLATPKGPGDNERGGFLQKLSGNFWPGKSDAEGPTFKKRNSIMKAQKGSPEPPDFRKNGVDKSQNPSAKPEEGLSFGRMASMANVKDPMEPTFVTHGREGLPDTKPPEDPSFHKQRLMTPKGAAQLPVMNPPYAPPSLYKGEDTAENKIMSSKKGMVMSPRKMKQAEGMIPRPIQVQHSPRSKGAEIFLPHRSLEGSFSASRPRRLYGPEGAKAMNQGGAMVDLPCFAPIDLEVTMPTGAGGPDRGGQGKGVPEKQGFLFSTPLRSQTTAAHTQFMFLPGSQARAQEGVASRSMMMPAQKGAEKKAPKGPGKCNCGKPNCKDIETRIRTEEERLAALRHERLSRLERDLNEEEVDSDGTESVSSADSEEDAQASLPLPCLSDAVFNTAAAQDMEGTAEALNRLSEQTFRQLHEIPRLTLRIRQNTHGPSPKGPVRDHAPSPKGPVRARETVPTPA